MKTRIVTLIGARGVRISNYHTDDFTPFFRDTYTPSKSSMERLANVLNNSTKIVTVDFQDYSTEVSFWYYEAIP